MRPLLHPAIDDIRLEGILHALSDPARVEIFNRIATIDCIANCASFSSIGDRVIPKSSLSQHFKVLREAGLIRQEREGVEMRNTSRCVEIDQRFPGLLKAILSAHASETPTRLA